MNASASSKKSPLLFFVLLFALSIPFWLIGAAARGGLPLPINLPVGALMFVCPLIAALILVYREDKLCGVRKLLKRVFDYARIKPKIWYLPIIFLLPIIYLMSYWAMCLMGLPLQRPRISFMRIPIFFVLFFVTAACEEAGWMGYAIDPMQDRWGALKASIILGLAWSIWHLVPDIQAHQTWAFIAGQRFYSVVLRILIVWLYNNTGKSVFAAILFHDMDNVSVYSLFPNDSNYNPAVTGVLTAIVAVIVTFLFKKRRIWLEQQIF